MKKFKYFGIVIHPKGCENYNWKNLSTDKITILLRELGFPTPKDVGITMNNLSVRGDKRSSKQLTEQSESNYYYGRVEQMFGQLELGEKNNRPHYQLWVSMRPQVPKTAMLRELSRKFYNEDKSNSISVLVLSKNNDEMIEYCRKEARANLNDEYSHVEINGAYCEYQKYLEENEDAKKLKNNLTLIKNG